MDLSNPNLQKMKSSFTSLTTVDISFYAPKSEALGFFPKNITFIIPSKDKENQGRSYDQGVLFIKDEELKEEGDP